ncbi:MAG: AAA family ATPase [Dongiaceae bacterium]
MARPRLWLLAGPNGAGKSTFARTHFSELLAGEKFLNADDVAGSASPGHPQRWALSAGRWALQRRTELLEQRQSFAIETTLASLTLSRWLRHARSQGYLVELTYLFVFDPDLCLQRIGQRVALGGHFVPTEIVMRRYHRSLLLLPDYLSLADRAVIYLADAEPRVIFRKTARAVRVVDRQMWNAILALSRRRR